MSRYGSITIALEDDRPVIVGDIPKFIGVCNELLDDLDPRWASLDGNTLTILGHRFSRIGPDPYDLSVVMFELVAA